MSYKPYLSFDPEANSVPLEKIGPHNAGRWFEVNKGQTYDIEILIGDDQGGGFYATLLYEEKGANYPKQPDGSPFYPVFELDDSLMPPGSNPPFPEKSEKVFEGMKPGM